MNKAIANAAELIAEADALVIAAGAGMGVDSGLLDFRGRAGFWNAYPALGKRGMAFTDIACPAAFRADPRLAWGFYGHRLNLYRRTQPHDGFRILLDWAARKPHGVRVFTSNVDGQFQAAGFAPDHVHACHGSIHDLQCLEPCHDAIWSVSGFDPIIDDAASKLLSEPPRCPRCGGLARPNVLMFDDWSWVDGCADERVLLDRWLSSTSHPVVIEVGAGTFVPTVRHFTQNVVRNFGGTCRSDQPERRRSRCGSGCRFGSWRACRSARHSSPPDARGGTSKD
jgi:NAD-dependent SIR2 family protein deacetylase